MVLVTLKFSTTGRPMVECINPKCGKIHGIYRKGEYLNRPQIKVVCSSCGTKWNLDSSDAEKLKAHYEERKKKNEEKNRQKEEMKQQKEEKPVQIKDENFPKIPEKTVKDKPKKKSFFESIWE